MSAGGPIERQAVERTQEGHVPVREAAGARLRAEQAKDRTGRRRLARPDFGECHERRVGRHRLERLALGRVEIDHDLRIDDGARGLRADET